MDRMLKTLTDLVKIPSVSGDEKNIRKALDYCKACFKGKKVFIREFSYKNASPILLVANKKTDRFDIMTLGHLDVVPAAKEQFTPKIEGNRLYGRGASDMKCGIVTSLALMDYVLENRPDLAFGVLIVTDEETTSNGIKGFVKEGITAEIVLDNDAGDLTTIVEKFKHPVSVKIKAQGLAGHSSRPWDNINAVSKLMGALAALGKYFPEYSKDGKKPKNEWVDTMSTTAFNSPTTTNVTPGSAEALVSFRLTEKTNLSDLEKILKKVCAKTSCAYEVMNSSSGCYMDAKSPAIVAYRKTAEQILGRKMKISSMCGATDSRMLAGQSTVIMHGFNGGDHHGANEYLEIDSLYKFSEIQKEFLKNYFRP